MRHTRLAFCIAAALSAVPIAASAQQAYALNGAEIYAGPGQDYPLVARIGPGVGVRVQGCLQDYTWCDVTFGGNRGWLYGGELGYAYQNRRVPVIEYGSQLALPVITFSLGNYWDRNYRGRTFYRERNDWERRWSDNRGGHEWRGNDRRGDWNVNNGRGGNYRNDYRNDNNRNEYRNDNNRNDRRSDNNRNDNNNRGNRVDGNLHGDGQGGYAPNVNRGEQARQPKFDNGADHQQ